MPAPASIDQFIQAASALGQVNSASFFKDGTTPEATGYLYSFWKDVGAPGAGTNPAAGSGTPGAGGTAYDLDAGGLWSWADVENSGKERYLTSAHFMLGDGSGIGTIYLYDRLVGVSGLPLGSTGNKNCNTVALPRYTDGLDVEAWLEITTASTANTGVVTLNSYTDTDNNTGQTGASVSFGTTAFNVGSAIRLPIDLTDFGVKAVATINVGTATTNGVANLVLAKRICEIPLATNFGGAINLMRHMGYLPRIYDGFTPWAIGYTQNGNAMRLSGSATAIYR